MADRESLALTLVCENTRVYYTHIRTLRIHTRTRTTVYVRVHGGAIETTQIFAGDETRAKRRRLAKNRDEIQVRRSRSRALMHIRLAGDAT